MPHRGNALQGWRNRNPVLLQIQVERICQQDLFEIPERPEIILKKKVRWMQKNTFTNLHITPHTHTDLQFHQVEPKTCRTLDFVFLRT